MDFDDLGVVDGDFPGFMWEAFDVTVEQELA
jgi:hypothetical protein